jgi:hypothetical protein
VKTLAHVRLALAARRRVLAVVQQAGDGWADTGGIACACNRTRQAVLTMLRDLKRCGYVESREANLRALLWRATGKPMPRDPEPARAECDESHPWPVRDYDHRALSHALGMFRGVPDSLARLPARVHRILEGGA